MHPQRREDHQPAEQPSTPGKVGVSGVQQVLDVREYVRSSPIFRYADSSRNGYVLQCTYQGNCWHMSSGREYPIGPGSVVWLDNLEMHSCSVQQAPWVFCSVQIIAPLIPLPSQSGNTWQMGLDMVDKFKCLQRAWASDQSTPSGRTLRVHALVADILADLVDATSQAYPHADEELAVWWDLESQVRHHLDQPISLQTLQEWSGLNRTTLGKLCHRAHGMSPMRRIKQLRIDHAAGLIVHTPMQIQDIARSVGYPRSHEFSRDFRRMYGFAPTDYREEKSAIANQHQ